ncbi:hypothetical protein [Desulfonatronospira sp.]|uniref:hypothetical protein n=1 Tax=Desulfonatronospira sp. TaxID=1962951 RepID=UPI0025C3D71B|nr:hypothetical protein [Desulfonatronospira sp.]
MGAIYAVYGAAIASTLVLTDRTEGLEGNTVLFMIINFLCFTYLFFFSVWFRNAVFFRLYRRVQQD